MFKINCNHIFDNFFIISEVAVIFDGFTACTVNLLDVVPRFVNLLGHFGMYVSYEIYVMLLFWYWVAATVGIPKKKWIKIAYLLPGIVSVCFISVIIYCFLTITVIIAKHRYISKRKKKGLFTTLLFIVIILLMQIIFPESLVSCIAATMITISIYLDMENPVIHGLEHYQNEMVMGFATLVENKDDNTGGHIRRSSAYALLIANNLRNNKKYNHLMTKDYLNNLEQSAPMHDI